MHVDRLNDQDAQILKLESGNVRGHTCKLVILEPRGGQAAPGVEELRRHIATRLDRAPRFRRRLAPTPLGIANPIWVDDAAFDIAKHVRPVLGGRTADRERLGEIVGGLMSERLDRRRPLWALDVLERLEDGSTALIWRIHHCMADGVSAVKLGSALLWDEDPQAGALEPAPLAAGAQLRVAPATCARPGSSRAAGSGRDGARGVVRRIATALAGARRNASPRPVDAAPGTRTHRRFLTARPAYRPRPQRRFRLRPAGRSQAHRKGPRGGHHDQRCRARRGRRWGAGVVGSPPCT